MKWFLWTHALLVALFLGLTVHSFAAGNIVQAQLDMLFMIANVTLARLSQRR